MMLNGATNRPVQIWHIDLVLRKVSKGRGDFKVSALVVGSGVWDRALAGDIAFGQDT